MVVAVEDLEALAHGAQEGMWDVVVAAYVCVGRLWRGLDGGGI